MVGGMVQNSQSLYSFTFNAIFSIHEYIYSHSTTKLLFKKYIYLHLTTYFLFTKIFIHIYGMYSFTFNSLYSFTFNSLYSFTFNSLYSFTFTIEILVQHGAIFIQHFLRTLFAHHQLRSVTFVHVARWRLSRIVARKMNWRVLSGVVFVKK